MSILTQISFDQLAVSAIVTLSLYELHRSWRHMQTNR